MPIHAHLLQRLVAASGLQQEVTHIGKMLMASCVPHRQWALGVVMERGVRAIENCGSRYAFHVFLLPGMPKQTQTSSMRITASPVPRFGPGQCFCFIEE